VKFRNASSDLLPRYGNCRAATVQYRTFRGIGAGNPPHRITLRVTKSQKPKSICDPQSVLASLGEYGASDASAKAQKRGFRGCCCTRSRQPDLKGTFIWGCSWIVTENQNLLRPTSSDRCGAPKVAGLGLSPVLFPRNFANSSGATGLPK
jgi:hypothetical protein